MVKHTRIWLTKNDKNSINLLFILFLANIIEKKFIGKSKVGSFIKVIEKMKSNWVVKS